MAWSCGKLRDSTQGGIALSSPAALFKRKRSQDSNWTPSPNASPYTRPNESVGRIFGKYVNISPAGVPADVETPGPFGVVDKVKVELPLVETM